MKLTSHKIISIIVLLIFSGLTFLSVNNKSITVFYLLYLFWFDELIKVIFEHIKYKKLNNQNQISEANKIIFSPRYFMLFIYICFIIPCYGFMLAWSDKDLLVKNISTLLFKNWYFNLTLIGFLFRSIYDFKTSNQLKQTKLSLTQGMLTLHLSIILGLFIWAFTTGKLGNFSFDLGSYTLVAIVVPFILIKLIIDIRNLKQPDETDD